MKSVVWITAEYFIDVDRAIVPYLSDYFYIDWIIIGSNTRQPDMYNDLVSENKYKTNLRLEYYSISSRWYMPQSYVDHIRFFNYVESKSSDVIYVDYSLLFGAFHAASKSLPIEKTILATHNVKTPKGARLEMFARFYMHRLLRHFKNFQVFSKNQQCYLNHLVQDKNVLYAPLALKNYGEAETRTKHLTVKNFLSFGHIRQYKRIDLLIKAAQLLYEETGRDFVVTIAGKCADWTQYEKLIRYPHLFELNIDFISDDEVSRLFSNADYLVLPYQDLAQSGAITVAFNYNIPVISSDIPQFLEFVSNGKNGFTFKSEDVNSLKNVLNECLSMDSDSYEQLKKTTKEYVCDNYSLSSICERYIEYFNKF